MKLMFFSAYIVAPYLLFSCGEKNTEKEITLRQEPANSPVNDNEDATVADENVVPVEGLEEGDDSEEYKNTEEIAYKIANIPVKEKTVCKILENLNMREGASKSMKVIKILKKGTNITHLATHENQCKNGNWYKINDEKSIGFACSAFMKCEQVTKSTEEIVQTPIPVNSSEPIGTKDPANTAEIYGDLLKMSYEQIAENLKKYIVLIKPADLNEEKYKTISYFNNKLPKSIDTIPKINTKLTEEEGRKLYFRGILILTQQANQPTSAKSLFGQAIKDGDIYSAPCASTTSQVLEYSARNAGLIEIEKLFAKPSNYAPTHNVEIAMQKLGFYYYDKKEYVAPPASIGVWSRYTWNGVKGHAGHIFTIFKDMGVGSNIKDLVGDNTRRSSEYHGHPYRMDGQTVGFWLPPGIYPLKRK